MPTLDEVMGAKTSFGADAATGVQVLSQMGVVVFDLYTRVVLPLDGYVFWVQSNDPTTSITVSGSFHYNTDFRQDESNNYAASMCVFTSLTEVNDLRDVAPNQCYIATEGKLKFAFSSQGYFYKVADLYHYRGFATYNDVLEQIIPAGSSVDNSLIVSNSLPIWLSFNTYVGNYGFTSAGLSLYPSFLVPDNEVPPYASVHVIPEETQALGGAPRVQTAPPLVAISSLTWAGGTATITTAAPHGIKISRVLGISGAVPGGYNGVYLCEATGPETLTYALVANPGVSPATTPGSFAPANSVAPGWFSSQLTRDRVRVTLYGERNLEAINFLNFVNQYTMDTRDTMGIMNIPTIRDEKRTQPELRVIAQKKTIEFEVSYYQSQAFNIAQQLIKQVGLTLSFS